MMGSSFTHVSPYLLGVFMLALACIPLVFVVQDTLRRNTEKKRVSDLRREARVAAELRSRGAHANLGLTEDWVGEARR